MKLLLDTHTLLWLIGKSHELSERVTQEIKNINNKILVSAVSLWEIALKYSIGKLIMDDFEIENIPKYCKEIGFELIPLEPVDAIHSLYLPQKNIHKDPFDRMLIYQCIKNEYIFVSKDTKIKVYKERLFQNFSFERATCKNSSFAGHGPKNCKSLGKTNRVLQEAQENGLKYIW